MRAATSEGEEMHLLNDGRRRYLIKGRLRVPFEGYRRARGASTSEPEASDDGSFSPFDGLTPAQAWQARQLLNRAERVRGRLTGPLLAASVNGNPKFPSCGN